MSTPSTQAPAKSKSKNSNKNKRNKNKNKNNKNGNGAGPMVNAPVARTQVSHTPAPKINRSFSNGDVEVEHTEYLQDINGTALFTARKIVINPGLYTSFPWLSQMARLYESYRFRTLRFEFRTESPTTAVGSVMAAVDYDATDPAPVSKQQMAAYSGYQRSAPWNNFKNTSSHENLSKRSSYYVRTAGLSGNDDPLLYDVGNLFLATERQANTDVVGELYVHYKVKLMTPQLSNPAVGASLSSIFNITPLSAGSNAANSAPLIGSGSCLNADPFTLTATAPYSCLISWAGRSTGPFTVDTSASDCTIQLPQLGSTTGASQLTLYSAQLSFLPGQIFSIAPSVDCTGATAQVGQFNTASL